MGDKTKNDSVLIISDTHLPYHHKHLFKFLRGIKSKYKPTRVIHIGDEADHHGINFHDHDGDLFSPGHELLKTQKYMKEFAQIFPVMDLVESNHGSMYYRKFKKHGIPIHALKTYNEILGVPKTWKWHTELTLKCGKELVYFCHGKTDSPGKLGQNISMSTVQGHYHASFFIHHWASPVKYFWDMRVGCLIDRSSLSVAYNRLDVKRPILGCGIIIDGVPKLLPMNTKNGKWNKVVP